MDPTDASVLQLLTITSDPPAQQSSPSASYISPVPALGSFKGVTVQSAAHLFELVANHTFNTESFNAFARAYIGNDIARYSSIVKACSLTSGVDGKQIWEISLALQSIRITVFGTDATFIMILGDLQNGVWKLHDPLLAEMDKLSSMTQAPPPKPKVKIPRPPNAFILYRSHYHSYVKARFRKFPQSNMVYCCANRGIAAGMHNNDICEYSCYFALGELLTFGSQGHRGPMEARIRISEGRVEGARSRDEGRPPRATPRLLIQPAQAWREKEAHDQIEVGKSGSRTSRSPRRPADHLFCATNSSSGSRQCRAHLSQSLSPPPTSLHQFRRQFTKP